MTTTTREQLIEKYLDFFKKNNHKIIPSSSLIPKNDPTVLFTTAGMHPLVPYLLGQKHPLGKRLTNVQKCIRTTDIEEVGDLTHHTFFEMLGNWSLGDYFKKEAITLSFEFLTKQLKIPIEKLAVSIFKGDKDAPQDTTSSEIWQNLGIPKQRIAFLSKKDNWWGPAGETGPCGPDTEIFFWASNKKPAPKKFNPNDKNWVEIWNNVFMEYEKTKDNKYKLLKQKNVDTGMGVERTLAILNNLDDNYLTSVWKPIINKIEHLSEKKYKNHQKEMRIIADHIKASMMILAEQVTPSNLGQGYVLRRLIRRTIMNLRKLGFTGTDLIWPIAESVFPIYKNNKELEQNKKFIQEQLNLEEQKFDKTLEQGLKKFNKISKDKKISGKEAFLLFQSFGFPIEMTQELAKEKNIKINIKEFEQELKKHQKLSQTASSGKFKSGLADNNEKTKKLHTATHLLNQALKQVLGKDIKQKGSNITPERLRFDFNFPRKLTEQELKKIETLVNKKISEKLEVKQEQMPLDKALKSGAEAEFGAKYPEVVTVYTIKNFSKEICTGPHADNTSQLGHFKIIKEQSSSAGVRRIKAILEN